VNRTVNTVLPPPPAAPPPAAPFAPAAQFVYGLAVRGLPAVAELPDELGPAEAAAVAATGSVITVRQTPEPPPAPREPDARGAVRVLADGRTLVLDRPTSTATFHGPPIPVDMLAHPYLSAVAVPVNRWLGRETFHSGSFLHGGRAYLLLGPRTAGKSTLLAALADRGVPIIADDIAVTDGTVVFAGPRSIDLREPVPVHPDVDEATGVPGRPSRGGSRTRLDVPAVPRAVPLGGWVFLGWADDCTICRMPRIDLLHSLARWRGQPGMPSDPAVLLRLSEAPAWTFDRPRNWSRLHPDLTVLLRALSGDHAAD
jgi:hypothetical protein